MEFVTVIGSNADRDVAVRVEALDSEQAGNLAWEWALKEGMEPTSILARPRLEVEKAWGDQSSAEHINPAPGSAVGGLDDVDAILAQMVLSGEAIRPWNGVEAVAVRAILTLSRMGGSKLAMEQARSLLTDLLRERKS